MKISKFVITAAGIAYLGVCFDVHGAPPNTSDGLASDARDTAMAGARLTNSRARLNTAFGDKGVLRSRGIFTQLTEDSSGRAAAGDAEGGTAGVQCSQPAGNCQANDRSVAHTSDGVEFIVAENFRPSANGSITGLCWHGGYFDFTLRTPEFPEGQECPNLIQLTQNNFRVRYFADNGGVPGGVIGDFRQSNGTLVFGNALTQQQIAARIREWEFVAQHAAVNVQAGQCYWIEITNNTAAVGEYQTCSWLWEGGAAASKWLLQDDLTGYGVSDSLPENTQFCLNVPLQESTPCQPPPPANDACAFAQSIDGRGDFPFNNFTATTDGPTHTACQSFGESQIEADVWFKWTSPCTDTVVVSTCGLTDVDTRIAVYKGFVCPVNDARLISCNDDRCGQSLDPRQSMIAFPATEDQGYLVRLGVFPGTRRGNALFRITCGPPDNANCPGPEGCCQDHSVGQQTVGCSDITCCKLVCMCDPLCCDPVNGLWDVYCATTGFLESGCGAQLLCPDTCDICPTSTVDCCVGVPTGTEMPGCSDPTCCAAVCAEDAFCCEREWDFACATNGFNGNGNGADLLCPELCGGPTCPNGTVTFVDPASAVVDARQPFPPNTPGTVQGLKSFKVTGPAGITDSAALSNCWALCETAQAGAPNSIAGAVDNGDGSFTINLTRAITTNAVTTLAYTADDSTTTRGVFTSHPANVNGDSASSPGDITFLIDILNGVRIAPHGLLSSDVDRSGAAGPPDILRVIDLLNAAAGYPNQLNRSQPVCGSCCP